MSGQTADYAATMDLTQVNRALAETTARQQSFATASGGVAQSLTLVEAHTLKASRGFWALEGGAKALQQRLAPQAAAISGISAALGENAGQTGKAVAAAGQLAAAYAAGGPLGVALAGAGVALNALVKHWDDLIKKQDEALRKEYLVSDDASALLRKARADVDALQTELGEAGMTEREKRVAAVESEIAAVDAKLTSLRAKWRAEGHVQTEADRGAITMLEETLEVLDNKRALAGAAGGLKDDAGAKTKTDPLKNPLDLYGTGGDDIARALASNASELEVYKENVQKTEEALTGVQIAESNARLAAHKALWQKQLDGEKLVAEAKKKAAEESIKAAEQEAAVRTKLAGEVVSIGVSASQQLVDGLITGQEHALEHAIASTMKAAGTAMIGHGIDAAAGGIAMLSLGNPAGGVGLATGGALIAGGLALGGVGTGIEHTLAGGTIGQALPKDSAAARDPGIAAPRSSRASKGEGGAGVTIVNNYAVGGPSADDAARANVQLFRIAQRRRLS